MTGNIRVFFTFIIFLIARHTKVYAKSIVHTIRGESKKSYVFDAWQPYQPEILILLKE